ncbi:MAG: hypothetical protein ACLFR2_00370 [Candidatus Kapaibacterium sp.]
MAKSGFHIGIIFIVCFAVFPIFKGNAQVNNSSPANWLYPNGNAESTRNTVHTSARQSIDSIFIKWSTPFISGDVQPLIGNIIDNPKLYDDFPFTPNELAAVMGDEIIIIDGAGRLATRTNIPGEYAAGVSAISVLFDTLSTGIGAQQNSTLVLGLETMEMPRHEDSLAYAYIAGFNHDSERINILKRLAIDLRVYEPNIFASIKPVYGKNVDGEILIYSLLNMSSPVVPDPTDIPVPVLRGITLFNTENMLSSFPMPDLGDDLDYRITLGPEVNSAQPSFTPIAPGNEAILLPSYPTPGLDILVDNPVTASTVADRPYLFGFDISGNSINESFFPFDFSAWVSEDSRPRITPYFLNIGDEGSNDSLFMLVAEEYKGIDGSNGRSRLHLFDANGDPLTFVGDPIEPPFTGDTNHYWSVAVGNVDGNSDNSWQEYYPNNPGNEIILSQSSADFAVPGSRLMVMRYNSGTIIEKPSPPNSFLFPFDTIATQRINGWVAAVNDLDNGDDGKDEIIIVDGSTIMIMKMRDYASNEFRLGNPFDTLFSHEFFNETISSVAIADLEGDGRNDIIVTTYDSTYVFGTINKNTIDVTHPIDYMDPPEEYCSGDTVEIEWVNKIRGTERVDINFIRYSGGGPLPLEPISIAEGIHNDRDTMTYNVVVDSSIYGLEGKFIVESSFGGMQVFDTTTVLNFRLPFITADPPLNNEYTVGETIELTGTVSCLDTALLQYSYDGIVWETLDTTVTEGLDNYSINGEIPCVDLFNCTAPDADSLILFRTFAFAGIYKDSSISHGAVIRPARLPVSFDTSLTACPTKEFLWDLSSVEYLCDTITISVSTDFGNTFTFITSVRMNEGGYLWQIPLNLPPQIVMRFCCENSCVRTDTVLGDYKPRFIEIVAPNPVRAGLQDLEVVYSVPEETSVNLKIFDQANNLVAEPVKNQLRNPQTAYCDKWDGRLANGALAANGLYYLMLELSNGMKEVYPVFVRK